MRRKHRQWKPSSLVRTKSCNITRPDVGDLPDQRTPVALLFQGRVRVGWPPSCCCVVWACLPGCRSGSGSGTCSGSGSGGDRGQGSFVEVG